MTYRIANLRGFNDNTGKRKKQRKKHTAAPRLHATKMSIRSHRLTVDIVSTYCTVFGLFPDSSRKTSNAGTRSPSHGQGGVTNQRTMWRLKSLVMGSRERGFGLITYRQKKYLLLHVDLPPAEELLGLHGWATAHNPGPGQTDCKTEAEKGKRNHCWCGRGGRGLCETSPRS